MAQHKPAHRAAHARYDAPQKTGQNKKVALIGVAAVVVVALVAVLVLQLNKRGTAEKPAATTEQTQESQTQMAQTEQDSAAQGQQGSAGQEVPAATSAQDLANDPRNTEFAVDSSRTEWNFTAGPEKVAYLTFDDGPSENTQTVLDTLDRYGIKATFFVTNINPQYADMIKECYARGHTIGMHTYSHEYDKVYASPEAYWADLDAISNIVREQIGYVPCFIRFPGGSSNTISANYTPGIMTLLSQEVVEKGYQYYDWDASCGDGAEHTSEELVEGTKWDVENAGRSVVFLMHDGAGKQATAEALPQIIEYFQSQGYRLAPIDRTTRVPHHGIGN